MSFTFMLYFIVILLVFCCSLFTVCLVDYIIDVSLFHGPDSPNIIKAPNSKQDSASGQQSDGCG